MKVEGLADFEKALTRYEQISSKTREEVLEHRARNLAYALHREAVKVGRSARRKIKALPLNRIKVHSGKPRSNRKEQARRMFAAGFVATGWIPSIKAFRHAGGVNTLADVSDPNGYVRNRAKQGFIELVNAQPGSAQAHDKHSIIEKALRRQTADMERYFARKAARDVERAWG